MIEFGNNFVMGTGTLFYLDPAEEAEMARYLDDDEEDEDDW